MSKAEVVLRKCFEKLTEESFNKDSTLKGFYASYKGYIDSTIKDRQKNRPHMLNDALPPLFDYYFEYLLRNSTSTVEVKREEVVDIQNTMVIAMFEDQVNEQNDDPRIGRKEVVPDTSNASISNANTRKPMMQINDNMLIRPKSDNNVVTDVKNDRTARANELLQSNKFKFSRERLLQIISECIANSLVSNVEENPEPVEDEKFKQASTVELTKQLNEEGIKIPEGKKDADFNRKNLLIEIWHACNQRLEELKKTKNYETLLKIYLIDTTTLKKPNNNQYIPYKIQTPYIEECKDVIPVETLSSKPLPYLTGNPGKLCVYNRNSLEVCIQSNRAGKPVLYVATEMQLNLGGNAEQGYETPIMPLYFSSTVSLAMSKLAPVYPLTTNQVFYVPFMIYLRDHTDPRYSTLDTKSCVPMKCIIVAPRFRPKTTINDISTYQFDPNLLLPETELKNPNELFEQICGVFNTAIFFGHSRIILDDLGVYINWLPAHHVAKIMAKAVNIYRYYFEEIIVAIDNAKLYEIYKGYF